MEDGYPDDEIEIELSPIAVQLAYVQQVLILFCLILLLLSSSKYCFSTISSFNYVCMYSFLAVQKMLLKLILR